MTWSDDLWRFACGDVFNVLTNLRLLGVVFLSSTNDLQTSINNSLSVIKLETLPPPKKNWNYFGKVLKCQTPSGSASLTRTECEGPHFTQKWVPIFTKPVWRIFSPGFMISEMNLWKFEHYFWKFIHYFSMETLFVKLLCRTPETVRNFALKVLNLDRCGEKLKQVPFS